MRPVSLKKRKRGDLFPPSEQRAAEEAGFFLGLGDLDAVATPLSCVALLQQEGEERAMFTVLLGTDEVIRTIIHHNGDPLVANGKKSEQLQLCQLLRRTK